MKKKTDYTADRPIMGILRQGRPAVPYECLNCKDTGQIPDPLDRGNTLNCNCDCHDNLLELRNHDNLLELRNHDDQENIENLIETELEKEAGL